MVYSHGLPGLYPSYHDDLYPPYAIDTMALPSETIVDCAPAIEFDITMTGRKIWKLTKAKSEESKAERVWPLEIETKLIEALERYKVPNQLPRRTRFQRFPRRNQFISEYILKTTGSLRTAKQVGSRLQQLRDSCRDPRITRLITDVEFSMNASSSSPSVHIGQSSAEMNFSSSDSDSPQSPFIKTAQPLPTRERVSSTQLHLSKPATHPVATEPNEPPCQSAKQEYYSPVPEPSTQYWDSPTAGSPGHYPLFSNYPGLPSFDDTNDYSPPDSQPYNSYLYSTTCSPHSSSASFSFYGGVPFESDPTQNSHSSAPFLEPLTLPSAFHPEESSATTLYAPPTLPSGGYVSVKHEVIEHSNLTAVSSVGTYDANTSSTSLLDALGPASHHDTRVPPVLDSRFPPAYKHAPQ